MCCSITCWLHVLEASHTYPMHRCLLGGLVDPDLPLRDRSGSLAFLKVMGVCSALCKKSIQVVAKAVAQMRTTATSG